MNIIAPKCSAIECKEFADIIYWSSTQFEIKCTEHTSYSGNEIKGVAARNLEHEYEAYIERFLKLKSSLNMIKRKFINSAYDLMRAIEDSLKETISEIDKNISNIDLNLSFLEKFKRQYDFILKNLQENLELDTGKLSFDSGYLKEIISSFFKYEKIFMPNKNSYSQAGLFDVRLEIPDLDVSKKLKILSNTSLFAGKLDSKHPPEDLFKNFPGNKEVLLKNPSQILIDNQSSSIFTLSEDRKSISIWQNRESIKELKRFDFGNEEIDDVIHLNLSGFLLVRYQSVFKKIDISKLKFDSEANGEIKKEDKPIIKVSKDEQYMVTDSYIGQVKLWNLASLTVKGSFQMNSSSGVSKAINCLDISSNNSWIVSGGSNGDLNLLEVTNPNSLHRVSAHGGGVTAVCFSPDLRLVVSGGEDKKIKVWEYSIEHGMAIKGIGSCSKKIRKVSFSFNSAFIISGCNGFVILWELNKKAKDIEKKKIKNPDELLKICGYFEDGPCYLKFYKQ